MPSSDSRFKFTPIINCDGIETYGRWVSPQFLNGNSAAYVVTNAFEGRADLISNELYKTPKYYWAIIAFNSPRDPLNWPKAGEVIRIPSLAAILSEL